MVGPLAVKGDAIEALPNIVVPFEVPKVLDVDELKGRAAGPVVD